MSRDLERLVNRCRAGDAQAWSALVDRFQALVYSVPLKHGLNSDDAADVFLQTFESLQANLDRIKVEATLPRWLAVTAARESLKVLRIRKKTSELDDLSLDQLVDSEEIGAQESAIQSWQASAIREEVMALAPRCRELLSLLYFEELPYDEITARMAIPIGAIGPTRARCLEKVRKSLEKKAFFDK